MVSSGTTSINFLMEEHKPNIRQYFVMDGDVVEYVVKVKTKKKSGVRVYKLFHSDGNQWLNKNELCLTMYDNGNGVKFKIPDKAFNLSKLDYHELQYISILHDVNISESHYGRCNRIIEDMGDILTCK